MIYSESDLFSCRNGKHVPVALVDCASNMLLFVSRLLLFVCLCFNVKALSKHFLLNVGIYLCRSWIYILLRSGFHCISVLVPRGKQWKSDVISKQYELFQAIEWYMKMRATRKIFCHLESFSSRDDKKS